MYVSVCAYICTFMLKGAGEGEGMCVSMNTYSLKSACMCECMFGVVLFASICRSSSESQIRMLLALCVCACVRACVRACVCVCVMLSRFEIDLASRRE